MEQVHLYRASTNGRPVKQSYTLTGSASIGPPTGKHQGKGPEPATRTPPHPPQPGRPGNDTRETPPQATRKRDRRGRARKRDGRGTHHQQTPARGAGEPHSRDGRGATPHSPHTKQGPQTTPRKARTGSQTHHKHTAHTLEHAPNTHPHNRHQHEPHKRTPHTKTQAPPAPQTQHTQTQTTRTQQPPPPGGLQGRQKPLGHKGGPTKPAARSGERPHPVTPERPHPTPGPGTTTPTPAPPPTPKPDATTPSPADTRETNGGTIGNTTDPSTHHNTRT